MAGIIGSDCNRFVDRFHRSTISDLEMIGYFSLDLKNTHRRHQGEHADMHFSAVEPGDLTTGTQLLGRNVGAAQVAKSSADSGVLNFPVADFCRAEGKSSAENGVCSIAPPSGRLPSSSNRERDMPA